MADSIVKVLNRAVDTVLAIVCLLMLFIGVWSLLDNLWLYQNATDKSLLVYRPALDVPLSAAPERLISGNQVAWLCLYDTSIDYPVMQGEDNYEYLNKDPYGEFNLSGSIFMDYRSAPDFSDEYSLIYGHHMAYGAMFGALDDYADENYFDEHRSGRIVTQSAVFDYELFAAAYADAGDATIFSPRGHTIDEITEFLNENSLIYRAHDMKAGIVALSTCSGDNSMARLLVFGTITRRPDAEDEMKVTVPADQ